MSEEYLPILIHLVAALVAGGAIGMERTFQARPAGFRTHALVCMASRLLMRGTLTPPAWRPPGSAGEFRSDPVRMGQGIMTGIGFLGAGVIFREGITVRGLTTAASIWVTAAIGILIGIGFYMPAAAATVLTLAALTLMRWVEARMPVHAYANCALTFAREDVMPEDEVRELLQDHQFKIVNASYRTADDGGAFEYRMVIRTTRVDNFSTLATALLQLPRIRSFRISPSGN